MFKNTDKVWHTIWRHTVSWAGRTNRKAAVCCRLGRNVRLDQLIWFIFTWLQANSARLSRRLGLTLYAYKKGKNDWFKQDFFLTVMKSFSFLLLMTKTIIHTSIFHWPCSSDYTDTNWNFDKFSQRKIWLDASPGSGGSCFSSLAIADSFGLGRGTSSAIFAGVEAAFDILSSSRLLWLQAKMYVFVQYIFRKGRHQTMNSVFWRCRAWGQKESFKPQHLHYTPQQQGRTMLNTKPRPFEFRLHGHAVAEKRKIGKMNRFEAAT